MKKNNSSKKYHSVNIFNYNRFNINLLDNNKSNEKVSPVTPRTIINKKEEIIYNNKSQKEMLLSLIKNSLLDLIEQIDSIKKNNEKKEKINKIKNFLTDLKGFLAYLLNEKIKNKDNLELNVNNSKRRLQKEISNNFKYDKNTIENNSIINKQKKSNSNIDTEMVEKNFVGSEVSKLKLQNFKTENEILKTESFIINSRHILNYLKKTNIFPEDNKEIFYYNHINEEKIDNEFNYMKQIENNKLDKLSGIIKKNREEQERYIKAINNIRDDIIIRNHILEKDTIPEISIEDRITSNS